jgi:predicted NAD/FAD-binding protein
MRLAIIGSGVSGLTCARLLSAAHDVTVFESSDWIGGHAHTVHVRVGGKDVAVDTGFIVFNDRNYPNFEKLLGMLGVESVATSMSFSVRCDRTGLEWGGENLNALFAQRRNMLRPRFLRMVHDIIRFGNEAPEAAALAAEGETLGTFLSRHEYSPEFVDFYLVPMGAAIWSMPRERMREFPLRFFIRFFENHGMLKLGTRPTWRTIPRGSERYVNALIEPIRGRIRTNCPVAWVSRREDGVDVGLEGGSREAFDQVIFATHSDVSLRLLRDASERERSVLGAIAYRANETVLHTDRSPLPSRRRAWSAWNYRLAAGAEEGARVTYCMNILQHIETAEPLCVTLNDTAAIDPSKILGRWTYDHPQYTLAALAAQGRHAEISGVNRTHYCGAYWFNGFHEDGVRSALRVCGTLGATL